MQKQTMHLNFDNTLLLIGSIIMFSYSLFSHHINISDNTIAIAIGGVFISFIKGVSLFIGGVTAKYIYGKIFKK